MWTDGVCNVQSKRNCVDHPNFTDYPCGWGRAGFGVGSVKGSALVPDSAINVCGWFGQDAQESAQKCELLAAAMSYAILFHYGCRAC